MPHRTPSDRGPARRWAALLALLACAGLAEAKGGRPGAKPAAGPAAGPVPLRGAPIRDLATPLWVPLSADRTLTLDLPPGFWIQAPRHLPVPTSLAGDGVIVQYLNPRGGSVSMLYVGSVPLHPAEEGEPPARRAERTALDFAAALPRHYERVDWTLTSAPVALEPATLTVGGRKTPGWRTVRYQSEPRDYAGPESRFAGACALFQPEGTEVLAYVALDAKAGGTTLDKALERVQVRSPRDLLAKGRRLQLNDLAVAADPARYPVRLVALDLPAGFVPTWALREVAGEWVYVEERLTPSGDPDAVLRISGVAADPERTLADVVEAERGIWPEDQRSAVEAVDLAVRGHRALLFSHPAPADGPSARALTAALLLDDQVLFLTWTSRTGAEQAQRDRTAFVALLRSIELAVRW